MAWDQKPATELALWGGGQSAGSVCASEAAVGRSGHFGFAFPCRVPAGPLPSQSILHGRKTFLIFFFLKLTVRSRWFWVTRLSSPQSGMF